MPIQRATPKWRMHWQHFPVPYCFATTQTLLLMAMRLPKRFAQKPRYRKPTPISNALLFLPAMRKARHARYSEHMVLLLSMRQRQRCALYGCASACMKFAPRLGSMRRNQT